MSCSRARSESSSRTSSACARSMPRQAASSSASRSTAVEWLLMQSLYRPPADEPHGALVLFHGRGADEHDLFPLLDILDPERRLAGATARGPLSLPPGGAHWYVVRRVGYPDPETFHSTYPLLAGWLDSFLKWSAQGQGVLFPEGGAQGMGRYLNDLEAQATTPQQYRSMRWR